MTYNYDRDLAPVVPLVPPLDLSDIGSARAAVAEMQSHMPTFVLPDALEARVETVPAGASNPELALHTVRRRNTVGPTPVLLWFHGGGFVIGSAADDLSQSAQFVENADITVISVDYRLAPEHRYPAALDDASVALAWVVDNAVALGIDPAALAVGGQSAGACIAAALAVKTRDLGGPAIVHQILDIPVLDDSLSTTSMIQFVDTPLWSLHNAELSWRAYLGESYGGDTPAYAAPARTIDLAGLPPAYVSACEFDPLRDEAVIFAHRLVQAGISTELHIYPGTFHGSARAIADAEVSKRMTADLSAAVARAFRTAPVSSVNA